MSPVGSQGIGGTALPTRKLRQRILRTRQGRVCRRGQVRHHQRSRSVAFRTFPRRPKGTSPTVATKSRFLFAKFDLAQIAIGQPNVCFESLGRVVTDNPLTLTKGLSTPPKRLRNWLKNHAACPPTWTLI